MRSRLLLLMMLAYMPTQGVSSPATHANVLAGFRLAQTVSPIPQITPQYNTPGAQLALPEPGNPVQQLAPVGSSLPMIGSPVPQLSPLGSTTAQPANPMAQSSPQGSVVP